jgi:hypothetical protein
MDPEGMVALLNYREDGITPYFTFFKDGLVEEKLVRKKFIAFIITLAACALTDFKSPSLI